MLFSSMRNEIAPPMREISDKFSCNEYPRDTNPGVLRFKNRRKFLNSLPRDTNVYSESVGALSEPSAKVEPIEYWEAVWRGLRVKFKSLFFEASKGSESLTVSPRESISCSPWDCVPDLTECTSPRECLSASSNQGDIVDSLHKFSFSSLY
jgi:hypothetical protein